MANNDLANEGQETSPEQDDYRLWRNELDLAKKVDGYHSWVEKSKKIIQRYRDVRVNLPTDDQQLDSKYNILWSNIQTLQPAIYAKPPKPIVERRFMDRDVVGRIASVVLERSLQTQIEQSNFYANMKKAVLDRLLPGRGVLWLMYEPTFRNMPPKTQEDEAQQAKGEKTKVPADKTTGTNPKDDDALDGADDDSQSGKPRSDVNEEVIYEAVCPTYIDWNDFLTSPARIWSEVRWVAKRVYLTRAELVKRFGKEKGEACSLDYSPSEYNTDNQIKGPDAEQFKKAVIWEIWNKPDRKVRWLATGYNDGLMDEKDDPLRLDDFFPCPEPLFATLTNESLIPVPDFHEYQDQAIEMDELTSRITAITKAIKAVGFYDASQKDDFTKLLEQGFENKMIPVDNWAQFAEKGGAMGAVSLLPMKELMAVLTELYAARDQVKQSLYEITGISDIVRGAQTAGDKTATEQRIKGQFASMRLNSMQSEVARFARDTLRLMGEIIAEHFDPMTLFLISGYEQYAKEQFPPEAMQAGPPPQMGHNGGPPMPPNPGAASPQPPVAPPGAPPPQGQPSPALAGAMPQPIDPVLVAQKKAADVFKQAVKLLKDEKLRGFRIDIETDSMIEADQAQMQQSRTQLLQAISQFLPEAMQAGQQMPQMVPLLSRLLLFFLRGYKASRDIESAFEQFIDDMEQQAKNPPPKPPSPDEIKAQAELQKAQLQMQGEQQKQQGEAQQMQLDAQLQQQKMQADLQVKQEEFKLDQQRNQMEAIKLANEQQWEERKHQMEMEKMSADITSTRHEAVIGGLEREHQHGLTMDVMEAKAAQAKKPKPNGGK